MSGVNQMRDCRSCFNIRWDDSTKQGMLSMEKNHGDLREVQAKPVFIQDICLYLPEGDLDR